MTIRDDLIAAKALIDTPEKWGKGELSFDHSYYAGKAVYPCCAAGALAVAAMRPEGWDEPAYIRAIYHLGRSVPAQTNVAGFNDDPATTHADIMALFDRAIAAAGAS